MTAFGETRNVISTVNSTTATTFAAGAEFQGVGEDVSVYGRVGVSIVTTNATNGTLTMEVSRDGTVWGGPSRTWADTRFAQPHMWNIVEQYFRIKYTNGPIVAENLNIQVQYSVNADILLGHQLDESLSDETEAIAVRAVLVGADEDGNYRNISLSDEGNLKVKAVEDNDQSDFYLQQIVMELKLLNLRFEEIHGSKISMKDIE